MQTIKIRKATIADAEMIAEMSRHSFASTFGPQNKKSDIDKYLNEQFTKAQLMAEVGTEHTIFLLAYCGQEPAGYVKMNQHHKETGVMANWPIEIARFYAMPTMIGKGIGKAMMQYCMVLASQLHHDGIWLGVWEKNQKAIAFYTAFGFKKIGEHDFLVGDDLQRDWLMERRIP